MNNTISNLSLSAYDILAVLTPGVILTSLLLTHFNQELVADNWLHIFIYIISSYIIGLLWKWGMENLFFSLRNNKKEIVKGMLLLEDVNYKKIPENNIREYYYAAYYYLQQKAELGAIIILEKQIALVRSILLFPIAICFLMFASFLCKIYRIYNDENTTLYSEKICTYLKNVDKDIIFYFLFFSVTSFLLYFWMKHTQRRIYKLVFETCYFSHQHEKIISQILPNESEKQISSNKKCAFTIVVESIRSFINRCCLRVCKKLRSFFDKLCNDNNTKN